MKKKILSYLLLLCCIFFATGAKIANAQEVNGYVEDSNIPCYSTWDSCMPIGECVTSVKCTTCTSQNMHNRQDKGSCNNCGCQ